MPIISVTMATILNTEVSGSEPGAVCFSLGFGKGALAGVVISCVISTTSLYFLSVVFHNKIQRKHTSCPPLTALCVHTNVSIYRITLAAFQIACIFTHLHA